MVERSVPREGFAARPEGTSLKVEVIYALNMECLLNKASN